MSEHHLRFVLRQYIEHKSPESLRLHVWLHAAAWLGLITALSQVPLWGTNAGTLFVMVSIIYWVTVDPLVAAAVGALSAAWALLPLSPWGPGHGLFVGLVAPMLVFMAMGVVSRLASVYHHEHAAFMNGESHAALYELHAIVWGLFHFLLETLLQAGWRPQLKTMLDARERQALRVRQGVPWLNWARIASCRAQMVSTPSDIDGLVRAVREARARGLRVRIVASGFSWSSIVASDEALIFCERLDRISVQRSDPPTVWADAGVTNRQLNRELALYGLCMPWNVVLETVRVAGIASTGTHGTGKATSTVGDLVEAFEIVDHTGRLRILSDETVGKEVMSAARLGLGLFGVIARVKLRVAPLSRVQQTDQRMPISTMLATLPQMIAAHDSVELYWFPFNDDAWVRTIDRTTRPRTRQGHGFWFRALNLFHNVCAMLFFRVIARIVPTLTPALLRIAMNMLPFRTRVMTLPESHHYRHWIELMPVGCLEVGFKVDADCANVRRAWEATQRLVQQYAARGLYPLNLTLNVRFIGQSGALLTPAYGDGITCYVEIMWMGRPNGWARFSSDLCREWLKVPGALPHWSKEFEHVEDVVPIMREHLGDRRRRFLDALAEVGVDPQRAFFNPVLRRVLTDDAVGEAVGS